MINERSHYKYSIIYNTCDKYDALWPGFFSLLIKYWPNCNRRIIFNSENKSFQYDGFELIKPINNRIEDSWSQRLLNSLDCVNDNYVLMILDDFYLKSPVNESVLFECIDRMDKDKNIKCYTFAWQPGRNIADKEQKDFELRRRFARYRVNAQIGLWRVDYLRKILRTYETPWQYELSGSFRSSIIGGKFLSLKKDAPLVFDYDFGFLIIRGKINRAISRYFTEKEALTMDFPYDEYVVSTEKKNGLRLFRIIKYVYEMIVSLFRH